MTNVIIVDSYLVHQNHKRKRFTMSNKTKIFQLIFIMKNKMFIVFIFN